jgi:glycerol-3-phosphate dehydrogenase (NAD(P)+)
VWASLAVAVRAADPGGTLPILSVAKGIEAETLLRPTQVLADALGGGRPLCALAGPAIGPEIARCLPATLVAASPDAALAAAVQETFSTDYLRLYTNGDLTGAELAGAAKNVIAIAAGILDGLRCGDNAKAGLLTRGLAEIVRLGTAMGARPETFYGLAGVGDLITTAISPVGRNRSVGEALGRGRKLDEILATAGHVAEGVSAVRGLLALAARHGVEMPIAESVRDVLFAGKDPITAISGLMSRSRKPETPAVSTAAPTR